MNSWENIEKKGSTNITDVFTSVHIIMTQYQNMDVHKSADRSIHLREADSWNFTNCLGRWNHLNEFRKWAKLGHLHKRYQSKFWLYLRIEYKSRSVNKRSGHLVAFMKVE